MFTVDHNKISLTRGDTAVFKLDLVDDNGEPYTPDPNDKIYFRVKQDVEKPGLILEKEIDPETTTLELEEADTEYLPEGTYYYEIEVVTPENHHFTVITKTQFKLTIELEDHSVNG